MRSRVGEGGRRMDRRKSRTGCGTRARPVLWEGPKLGQRDQIPSPTSPNPQTQAAPGGDGTLRRWPSAATETLRRGAEPDSGHSSALCSSPAGGRHGRRPVGPPQTTPCPSDTLLCERPETSSYTVFQGDLYGEGNGVSYGFATAAGLEVTAGPRHLLRVWDPPSPLRGSPRG